MSGTVPVALPIGPLTLLRFAMNFTGMIGGTVATTATVIRFNQRRGLQRAVAMSSGIVYSVVGVHRADHSHRGGACVRCRRVSPRVRRELRDRDRRICS